MFVLICITSSRITVFEVILSTLQHIVKHEVKVFEEYNWRLWHGELTVLSVFLDMLFAKDKNP